MFRPVRRKSRQITDEAARQLLRQERRGVLAVNGDDGYPYAMPLNFYYDEPAQKIYFHGAAAGHKADALAANDKVCFTVYGDERADNPDEAWAPFVSSAVVFGRCRLLGNGIEAEVQLRKLAAKYYPSEDVANDEIAQAGKAVRVYAIDIEHLTGKRIQEK